MTLPGMVIYNDPVGGAAMYEGLPPPGLILVTHEHADHFDPPTLAGLVGENTRLLTNPSVHDKLPADLKARATAIANGESTTANAVTIEAIPAYNITADRMQYHPVGRDNGYVLTIGGKRVYIAGDTEDVPEMRALEAIDVAFVPMNLPYTMSVEQAAPAVAAFAPAFVYPYHYGEQRHRRLHPPPRRGRRADQGRARRLVPGLTRPGAPTLAGLAPSSWSQARLPRRSPGPALRAAAAIFPCRPRRAC